MEPLAQNVKDRRIDLIISKAKVQQHKISRSAKRESLKLCVRNVINKAECAILCLFYVF